MAQFTEEVVVKLTDQFSQGAAKIAQSTNMLSDGFKFLVGGAGLAGLATAIKKTVDAYAEQERIQTQLSFSLRSVGVTAQSVTNDYMAFAEELAKTSVYTKEQIQQVEILFTQYGLYGAELKRATMASMDFAAATGQDLQSAALAFAKASEGSTMQLNRYGIKVSEATLHTKGLSSVLEASEGKFKGFAQAAADTESGGLNQFSKAIHELMESIGQVFVNFDKRIGATSGLTGFVNQMADGLKTLQDPINIVQNKIRDLSDEITHLEEVQKSGGSWWDTSKNFIFGDDTQKQIIKTKAELAGYEAQLRELTESLSKGSVKAEDFKKKIKADPRTEEEWKKFYDDLVAKNAEGFKKIGLERDKDLHEIKKYLDKGIVETKQAEEAKSIIRFNAQKKEIEMVAGTIQQTGDMISTAMKGNLQSTLDKVQSMLPPVLGAIMGAGRAVGGAIGAIMDALAGDTRTTTQKMLDDLQNVMAAFNKAESIMNDIQHSRDKINKGLTGAFNPDFLKNLGLGNPSGSQSGVENSKKYLEAMGMSESDTKSIKDRAVFLQTLLNIPDMYRVEKNPSSGDYYLYEKDNDQPLAIMDHTTGKAVVPNAAAHLTEQGTANFLRFLIKQLQAGKLVNYGIPEFADGGLVPGKGNRDNVNAMLMPGEFVVSKKGVNQNTLGLLRRLNSGQTGGGSQVIINLSAIDEQGVSKFLKDKLAPMMRDLSGRNGVVFLNQKGVSSNI